MSFHLAAPNARHTSFLPWLTQTRRTAVCFPSSLHGLRPTLTARDDRTLRVGFSSASKGATSLRRGPAIRACGQSSRATTLLTATRPSRCPQTSCNHIACCCPTRRRPSQPRLPSWALFQALLIPTCFLYISRSLRPRPVRTNASLKHSCRQMCCTEYFDRSGKPLCRSATVYSLTRVYRRLFRKSAASRDRCAKPEPT